jgi:glucosamine kinase
VAALAEVATLGNEFYFCVDGGGTKSRGRLFDAEGAALADAIGGPCNPATDLQVAVASIADLWRQCCAAIGRDPERHEGVVLSIGAAGTYIEAGRRAFLAACPPFARFCSVSDGYAALIGAGQGAPCGLLIAGTGVAGHRLYPNGLSIQRDAWGWIAGDRGSGSWMGQKALRHCLAALDGVVPNDGLSETVFAAIGGVEGLRAGWMRGLGPDRLASLAPMVLEQADAGVALAQRIRARAVDHLAALAAVVAGPGVPFYAAGGLIAPLRALLSDKTGLPILEPKSDALRGCWLVATGKAPEERALLFGENVEHCS